MEFVYPSFLYALSLLSIPLAIHFLNLRRYKKIYFSNVPLLEQLQTQSRTRDRLKRIGLLVCRLLVFTALILAFCQPYLPKTRKGTATAGSQLVSIYLDNSYSMSLPGREGNLLEEGRKKAAEIAGAFDQNTRFQLLTNDFEGRHQRLVYRDELVQLLARVHLSPLSRNVSEILSRQHSLLDGVPGSRKFSFLISDFQQNTFSPGMKLGKDKLEISLVRLVSVSRHNLSIDSVWNLNKVQRPGEKEQLVIRLSESSADRGEGTYAARLQVSLNGRLKALANTRVRENSSVNDTVNYLIQDPGPQRLEVGLDDQPINFDDHFFGAWNLEASAGVMVINGEGENPFLRKVYQADPYFKFISEDEGHISYSLIAAQKLIILDRLRNPATALGIELGKYLAAGGNVLYLPATNLGLAPLKRFLAPFQVDSPDTLVRQHLAVRRLNMRSDLFEGVFDKYPENPDLPVVSYYLRYTRHARMVRENLMTLGNNDVLLARYNVGHGHWYQSGIPFTDSSGNFQRHALFVPVMYKLALLTAASRPLFYTIGKDHSIVLPQTAALTADPVSLTTDRSRIIPEIRRQGTETSLYFGAYLNNAGIYTLEQSGRLLGAAAFNYNRSESRMLFYSSADLQQLTGLDQAKILASGTDNVGNKIKQSELGTQLWKVCLIFGLVFLALEEIILRFGTKQAGSRFL